MASDLKTRPGTDDPALNGLVMIGMMYVTDGDKATVPRGASAGAAGAACCLVG
jgi:hypothetical protein